MFNFHRIKYKIQKKTIKIENSSSVIINCFTISQEVEKKTRSRSHYFKANLKFMLAVGVDAFVFVILVFAFSLNNYKYYILFFNMIFYIH